ncbi:MAG: hypothetical protein IIW93_01205 [Bacteroidaceae bacterium]|nr:hypothetical protein [Bacteroidaceae bacterium]MBQ5911699.1 hypothetical protein [Bacteroidaceae bacterium]
MQSKRQIAHDMLAVAVILLSLAYFCSCTTSRKMNNESDKQPQADSVDIFVPTHPPVVVPHSWRESGKK